MHTLLVFFGWPMGAVYGNIQASLLVAAWVTAQARSVRVLQAEMRDMHERHHAEHMNALSLDSPGGLAAVMSAAQDAKSAAESAHGAVQGLALVTGTPQPAATGKTPLRRAASGRFIPRNSSEGDR